MIFYHGVLTPAAHSRSQIVAANPMAEADSPSHLGCRPHAETSSSSPSEAPISQKSRNPREQPTDPRPRKYSWAELMRRVWAVDVGLQQGCWCIMRATGRFSEAERAVQLT